MELLGRYLGGIIKEHRFWIVDLNKQIQQIQYTKLEPLERFRPDIYGDAYAGTLVIPAHVFWSLDKWAKGWEKKPMSLILTDGLDREKGYEVRYFSMFPEIYPPEGAERFYLHFKCVPYKESKHGVD